MSHARRSDQAKALWLALTAIFAALGCQPTTEEHELLVTLRTDLVAEHEFHSIEVTLLPLDRLGSAIRRVYQAQDRNYVDGVRIDQLPAVTTDAYRLGLALRDGEGQSLVERPVLLNVSESTSVTVNVTRSCLNVSCGDDQACLGGQCLDARCTPESPEFCAGQRACEEDADCGSTTAACATHVCRDGLCFAVPATLVGSNNDDKDTCEPETSWCHPEAGCLAVGSTTPQNEATCGDGIRNGIELRIDCGGDCAPCPLSSVVDAHCRDGRISGDETGIDCGGSCTDCAPEAACDTQQDMPIFECLALAAFHRATTEAAAPTLGFGWNTDTPPCLWEGVSCTNGRVSELKRRPGTETPAFGSIPPELANLTALESLTLTVFGLGGGIPPELGLLTELAILDLRGNGLFGTVPPELGNLTKLRELYLQNNRLSGTIPASLGRLAGLERLRLHDNALTGSVPSSLGELSEVWEVLLYKNELTGTIPPELDGMTAVRFLYLYDNRLEGAIPDALTGLPAIQHFSVARNRLRGAVPQAFADNSSFQTFQVRANACLWAEANCNSFVTWLDEEDANWRVNTDPTCNPPPTACP